MKVLFLGDSITLGVPGIPYVEMIDKALKDSVVVNRGLGGDTVSSLYRRVSDMDDLNSFDQIILFVGVNDVFGKMTNLYKLIKTIKRQKWADSLESFKQQYGKLVTYITKRNSNILIIPPLVIGEEIHNKWNQELRLIREIIYRISNEKNLPCLDVYEDFEEFLSGKIISNYLPKKITTLYKESKIRNNPKRIDKISADRNLHLTLDGVHLNSSGSKILSKKIIKFLNELDQQ